MAVDNNGNVYVLKNESMENGTITATGDSDVTYQIIYEDNSVALASMISQFISAFLILRALLTGKEKYCLRLSEIRFDKRKAAG